MPAKGSSSSMNDGLPASARAISQRRRSPPDSAIEGALRSRAMSNSSSSELSVASRAVLEVTEPDRDARETMLNSLLDEFDIARLRKAPSIALSGGERRRCEIARALAGKPSFMLLDEPFAGIDPIAVGDIQDLVRHLKGRGIGVLITDHNVRETLGLIDRAYIIHSGHVLTEGSPDEIVAHPDVRRFYLGEDFRM